MNRVRRTSLEPRIELMPLMDVVFLLLTFFIFALALMVKVDVTNIQLPRAVSGETAERVRPVTVAVDAQGAVTLDGEEVSLEEVGARVNAELGGDSAARLFIAVDERTPSGIVFQLVDALKAEGISDLKFLRRVVRPDGAEREDASGGPANPGPGGE